MSRYRGQHCIVKHVRTVYGHHRGREGFDSLHHSLDAELSRQYVVPFGGFDDRSTQKVVGEQVGLRSLAGRDASGCNLYTTTFPCFQCARYIVDERIGRVVYVEAYPVKTAKDFLLKNNVEIDAFQGFKARAFLQIFRQVD